MWQLLCLPISICCCVAPADVWPAFRGSGDSVSSARQLPLAWSTDSGVAWTAQLRGVGQSSPIIWRDRVFATSVDGPQKERAIVGCFDLGSGHKLWETEFKSAAPAAISDYTSRAAPTPACDAERVFAFFETGNLVALDHDGKILWSRSLTDEYGKFLGNHGLGSSIALFDDLAIVLIDHDGPSYLLAVEKATGNTAWKVDRPQKVSWSSPIVAGSQVVISSNGTCEAFDARTGGRVWSVAGITGNTVPSATVSEQFVCIGSSDIGFNLAIRRGGQGDVSESHVAWRSREATATFSSPLVYQGQVYLVNRAGVAFCLDEQTGKTLWTRRLGGSCWASPLGACGRVYFFEKSGATTVAAAGPVLEVLAENSLPTEDRVYGVAAVEERIVIRSGGKLTCVHESSAIKGPTAQVPAAQAPAAQAPTAQVPAAQLPAAQAPAADGPTAETPTADGPAVKAPADKPSPGEAPDGDAPADNKQAPMKPADQQSIQSPAYPDLPKAITSFGAAVLGDAVYVFGGFEGQAHHYYDLGQSGDLLRLSINADIERGAKWQTAASGPRLQGLALVASGQSLYRLGGFEARNKEGEAQDLWSVADFVRFDPHTSSWHAMPPMPSPRSSFDAIAAGDTVYAVGGWIMRGDQDTLWQDTAYAFDLAAESPAWQELPKPPFQRRALAVGSFKNQLYAIGGMQPDGKVTRNVNVYNPASREWSEGPELPGEAMEGFGAACCAATDRFFVSTSSGKLLRLSEDERSWQLVRQLHDARFFHRMLPVTGRRVALLAGANMRQGKYATIELAPTAPAVSQAGP